MSRKVLAICEFSARVSMELECPDIDGIELNESAIEDLAVNELPKYFTLTLNDGQWVKCEYSGTFELTEARDIE